MTAMTAMTSRLFVFCACAVFLAGCQVELYRSVPEREANLMIASLANHDIEASKEEGKEDGFYSIWVEENEFSYAVELLVAQGHPRRVHQTLAQIFQPSGLVPTPFEERVRYIYGLSEELSHTVSLFEGVIDTRVHVSLPAEDGGKKGPLDRHVSVYVKYDQSVDFDNLVPQIKKLISDSVGEITYENVEVLAIPAYLRKSEDRMVTAYKFPAGIRVLPEYYGFFIALMIAIFLIVVQAVAAAGWFYWLWRRTFEAAQAATGSSPAALPSPSGAPPPPEGSASKGGPV